ncbi:endonuclease/exonuclease/phosphatase family protein [Actinomycetota bacterium]
MRLLALNVSSPPEERAKGLLEYLWLREEELLVLTEVGAAKGSGLIRRVCRAAGYAVHSPTLSGRELGVSVIGRGVDVEPLELPPLPVLPERVTALRAGGVRVLGVYGAASDPVRYSSAAQRERKREWLAAYALWLVEVLGDGEPTVVVGDLNIVDPLSAVGLRYVQPEEREVYEGMVGPMGLVDAYQHSHPGSAGISWVDHSGAGCRYDHAFVTPDLVTPGLAADLDHTPREAGLSDHSALAVRL